MNYEDRTNSRLSSLATNFLQEIIMEDFLRGSSTEKLLEICFEVADREKLADGHFTILKFTQIIGVD